VNYTDICDKYISYHCTNINGKKVKLPIWLNNKKLKYIKKINDYDNVDNCKNGKNTYLQKLITLNRQNGILC